MKLIKVSSQDEYFKSDAFAFKPIEGLSNFDVLTSYIEGESPEYQNEMDKLFMVLEGKVQLKVDKRKTKITAGDIFLLQGGEKFTFNAHDGAKLLQFNYEIPEGFKEKIMDLACKRHSKRGFIDKPVLKKDMYYILKIGIHAPSGANRQPWQFIVVGDSEVKRKIREAAEKVEKVYYKNLENNELKNDLKDLGLSWKKPFLEEAPFLICLFGKRTEPYYKESLWLATGWIILAAEEMGLSTLTYTPADLSFLVDILDVNTDFIPELIIPIGYTESSDPPVSRKDIFEVVTWV